MLHTPAFSTHMLVDVSDGDMHEDPFADPVAIARVREQHRSLTPTIRESDVTLVDQAPLVNASTGGRPVSGFQTVPEDSVLDPFKDPAPQLFVSPSGARNRLSNVSSQRSSLITDDSSVVSTFSFVHIIS